VDKGATTTVGAYNVGLDQLSLTPGTKYYVRAFATNATGTAYGSELVVYGSPAAFTVTTPLNNATGVSTSPTLSWSASTGATDYEYCVAVAANISADCTSNMHGPNWHSTGGATSANLSGLLSGTNYLWGVRAVVGSPASYTWGFNGALSFTTASTPSYITGSDTTGVFRLSNGTIFMKNANDTSFADIAINYGIASDYPVTGDWDGNGTATIGIYRNGSFYLRNSNTPGFAELTFAFGQAGDQPIAGDWDGDGIDTIGIFRPSTGQFLLRNSNSSGVADMSFYLGNVGDVGIAGDWNGDGIDTTGVFRPSNGMIFMKNTNATGFADIAINYGLAGDQPVTGDWDNDGTDTIGVYRNATFYLRNSNTPGFADIVFGLGNPGDMPISGNWDGSIP
jgi:hypothetical protein